jgi:LacI family transcriptional regulator
MFKPPNLKHIAEALSVSISTVSRALNDSHEVSAATKKLVCDYAKKINYSSNPAATTLRTKKSKSIAVVMSDIDNSFFSQVINGIEAVSYQKGYHVMIAQTHDSYAQESAVISHFAGRSVDGILLSVSSESNDYSHVINFHDLGLPFVFFDRIVDQINTFKVITNNFKASFEAVDLLIKNGYYKIAHLTSASQLSITRERLKGYKAALEHNGIAYEEALVGFCPTGGRDVKEVPMALDRLLLKSPQAIFIGSDSLCTATQRKLPTTSKIKLLGFSNSNVIDIIAPKISYIRQRAYEMGQKAAEKLIYIIERKYPIEEFETIVLEADLHWEDEFK